VFQRHLNPLRRTKAALSNLHVYLYSHNINQSATLCRPRLKTRGLRLPSINPHASQSIPANPEGVDRFLVRLPRHCVLCQHFKTIGCSRLQPLVALTHKTLQSEPMVPAAPCKPLTRVLEQATGRISLFYTSPDYIATIQPTTASTPPYCGSGETAVCNAWRATQPAYQVRQCWVFDLVVAHNSCCLGQTCRRKS
jgi:hypothetical protein